MKMDSPSRHLRPCYKDVQLILVTYTLWLSKGIQTQSACNQRKFRNYHMFLSIRRLLETIATKQICSDIQCIVHIDQLRILRHLNVSFSILLISHHRLTFTIAWSKTLHHCKPHNNNKYM
jgi:hypothetical protein